MYYQSQHRGINVFFYLNFLPGLEPLLVSQTANS
jgi:hypothetical protein